jgi:uncharacterized protein (DUF2147 family)
MTTKGLILILLVITTSGYAQTGFVGKWKTIDDESGEVRSVVEIFERGGKLYGRVFKIFPKQGEDPDPVCDACPEDDPRHKKKIIGMEIIKDMTKSGNEYSEGTILDPEPGKIYRCKLWLEGNDLMVRGFWGPFYRTQTWTVYR